MIYLRYFNNGFNYHENKLNTYYSRVQMNQSQAAEFARTHWGISSDRINKLVDEMRKIPPITITSGGLKIKIWEISLDFVDHDMGLTKLQLVKDNL